MTLGPSRVREIRKHRNLSRAQLAVRAGVSHETIVRLETLPKGRTITVETAAKVARALECSIADLFADPAA